MKKVEVLDWKVDKAIEVVRDLKSKGYEKGVDFDFYFYPGRTDSFSYEPPTYRKTIFKFYKDELATWFELVYI